MTAENDKSVGLTDANFIQYITILAMGYDVTITNIDVENRVIEMNGAHEKQVEFAMLLEEKLGEYLV